MKLKFYEEKSKKKKKPQFTSLFRQKKINLFIIYEKAFENNFNLFFSSFQENSVSSLSGLVESLW